MFCNFWRRMLVHLFVNEFLCFIGISVVRIAARIPLLYTVNNIRCENVFEDTFINGFSNRCIKIWNCCFGELKNILWQIFCEITERNSFFLKCRNELCLAFRVLLFGRVHNIRIFRLNPVDAYKIDDNKLADFAVFQMFLLIFFLLWVTDSEFSVQQHSS